MVPRWAEATMRELLCAKCINNPQPGRRGCRADHVGKLIETWVYQQLRPEVDLQPLWQIHHFRSSNKREIDFLLVNNERGELLGIEVKASQKVSSEDFVHLTWFAEKCKGRKFTGIVFYTGNLVTRGGENLYGIPMACSWED